MRELLEIVRDLIVSASAAGCRLATAVRPRMAASAQLLRARALAEFLGSSPLRRSDPIVEAIRYYASSDPVPRFLNLMSTLIIMHRNDEQRGVVWQIERTARSQI